MYDVMKHSSLVAEYKKSIQEKLELMGGWMGQTLDFPCGHHGLHPVGESRVKCDFFLSDITVS